MTFDVDLNAGPLNSFAGMRMTWRTSLRWREVWPGQTWRDRNGQYSPRQASPRERSVGGRGGASEQCRLEVSASPSKRRSRPEWSNDMSICGRQTLSEQAHPKDAGADRRHMARSRSDPGLAVRLPCLTSSPKSSIDNVGYPIRLPRKDLSNSPHARKHLPPLESIADNLDDDGEKAAEASGSNGAQQRRRLHRQASSKASIADKAIARSRSQLAQASGLLAESRCYGTVPESASKTRVAGTKSPKSPAPKAASIVTPKESPAVFLLFGFKVGDSVEVQKTDGSWKLASVKEVQPRALTVKLRLQEQRTFSIAELEDGLRSGLNIRRLQASTSASSMFRLFGLKVGDAVEVEEGDGSWTSGALSEVQSHEVTVDLGGQQQKVFSIKELEEGFKLGIKIRRSQVASTELLDASSLLPTGMPTVQSPSSRRKGSLKQISSMSDRILDELDGACKSLQERGLETTFLIDSPKNRDSDVPDAADLPVLRNGPDIGCLVEDVLHAVPGTGGTNDVEPMIGDSGSAPGPAADTEVESRDRADSDLPGGFSEAAVARMRAAFFRFTEPFSYDLDISHLVSLVKHLGNGVTTTIRDGISSIVKEMTPYEYLDFDEFLRFMEKFQVFSQEENCRVFNSYDDDGSGELSVLELRQVMKSLGLTPYNAKLKEAVAYVDKDSNGQLGYEEFAVFLHEYQTNNGFTASEVADFQLIHQRLRNDQTCYMPLSEAADALVLFYGIVFSKQAKAMVDKLIKHQKEDRPKADVPDGLSFDDYVLLARELREDLHRHLQKNDEQTSNFIKADSFDSFDADGSGCISEKELWKGLRKDGQEPLKVVVDELFKEVVYGSEGVAWANGAELDFDQFFDFMLLYRQRECFLKAEVDVFWNVFNHFDEDVSGTISTLELGDVFRHLGYILKLDQIERYVLKVDENQSHTLDFKEFLHLMQLHRSSTVKEISRTFYENCKDDSRALDIDVVLDALEDLGYKTVPAELKHRLAKEGAAIDLGKFVAFADECRIHCVNLNRRMAGFTAEEIERLKTSFETFDKDHSGTIGTMELMPVLEEFGWKPKTHEDRDGVMSRLGKAREAAKAAGVEESTPVGSADVNFWEFVQLARMIQRHDETIYEEQMANLASSLKFTHHELAEFHEIFHGWAEKSHQDDSDAEQHEVGDSKQDTCSKEYARRLVRSLGVKFTPERRHVFDDFINKLVPDGEQLDFPNFLNLMRWMLDTNFLESTSP